MSEATRTSRALVKLFTDTSSPEELGAKIERDRGALGLSIAALASRSGVGSQTIRKIEAGKSNAQLNTLIGIALALYDGENPSI